MPTRDERLTPEGVDYAALGYPETQWAWGDSTIDGAPMALARIVLEAHHHLSTMHDEREQNE